MAIISFDEGAMEVLANGVPSTCYFLLSRKPCSGAGAHAVTDTLSGAGVGEINAGGTYACTGYARKSQPEPTVAARAEAFSSMTWDTGSATDWPPDVKSCVLVTSLNNSGKALLAWDLAATRDMSHPHVTETFTPTLTI